MKYLLLLIYVSSIYGIRDPFSCANNKHLYMCITIGYLNDRACCATIVIDGYTFCVRKGQSIYGHTVRALYDTGVVLQDPEGTNHILIAEKKALQLYSKAEGLGG